MKVNLNNIMYYFLTTDTNGARKKHMMEIFSKYNITEVNPIMNIGKQPSGASGFSRMIDLALRKQDRALPFQPFILLEDDCSMYREFPEDIEIPDDTDILYIGTSICGLNKDNTYKLYMKEINNDIIRIYNMLSTHGIMICSALGALAIQKCMMEAYIMNKQPVEKVIPWDIYTASIQLYYNVYALKNQLVYQDEKYGGDEYNTSYKLLNIISEDYPECQHIECVSVIVSQNI